MSHYISLIEGGASCISFVFLVENLRLFSLSLKTHRLPSKDETSLFHTVREIPTSSAPWERWRAIDSSTQRYYTGCLPHPDL